MRAAVLFLFLSAASALATPPSRRVSAADRCKVQNGCFVVLFETLEKPPTVPGAAQDLEKAELGAPPRTTPVALPPDPGGDYEFAQGCSSTVGYYAVAQRRSGGLTRVKIHRAFNDPTRRPFAVELPPGFGAGPQCERCPLGAAQCTEAFTCPPAARCLQHLPPFGTKFIAVIQRRGDAWEFSGSTWKERWTVAHIALGWPTLATDDMVKALDAAFNATLPPKK